MNKYQEALDNLCFDSSRLYDVNIEVVKNYKNAKLLQKLVNIPQLLETNDFQELIKNAEKQVDNINRIIYDTNYIYQLIDMLKELENIK